LAFEGLEPLIHGMLSCSTHESSPIGAVVLHLSSKLHMDISKVVRLPRKMEVIF
jgi:hypothetical protein